MKFRIAREPARVDYTSMSDTPHRILFVCMGNICRSPAAEIIFRHQVAEASRSHDFFIDSAGTIGYHTGNSPDPRMSDNLSQRGYRVAGRSRQILPNDLEKFDLILTMDEDNQRDVLALDPDGRFHHKVKPFVDYLRYNDAPRIPDPYYGGQRGFEQVIELLEDACSSLLEAHRSS